MQVMENHLVSRDMFLIFIYKRMTEKTKLTSPIILLIFSGKH